MGVHVLWLGRLNGTELGLLSVSNVGVAWSVWGAGSLVVEPDQFLVHELTFMSPEFPMVGFLAQH